MESKKILVATVLASLLLGLMIPVLVSAQEIQKPNECCKLRHKIGDLAKDVIIGEKNGWCDFNRDGTADTFTANANWGVICLVDSIMTFTDWIFYILLLIAVIMIILGGFVFMTAAGSPEKASKGRNILVYAVIGIVIAILAKLVPVVVRYIVGL